MPRILLFDIETGANERAKEFVKPFDKNNSDHCKYGNAKNPELRESIEKQAYAIYMSQAEESYPKSAITGKILAISYTDILSNGEKKRWVSAIGEGATEIDLLNEFWVMVELVTKDGGIIAGFNIKGFDIPFIVQRSWINNVKVYPLMYGKWYMSWVVDLYEIWTLNIMRPWSKYISNKLADVAVVLGIGSKTGDGKQFEKIFYSDRARALEYSLNDIDLTTLLYERVKDFITFKGEQKSEQQEV